jgi:hypothetical protein
VSGSRGPGVTLQFQRKSCDDLFENEGFVQKMRRRFAIESNGVASGKAKLDSIFGLPAISHAAARV